MLMKIIFYGNILRDGIEDINAANLEKQRIINEFLTIGMDVFNITRNLKLPRAIIKNYPETLDKNSELYIKINKLWEFFGEQLTQINYIPISGDLHLVINGEDLYLSNILLAISCDIGDVKII